MSAPAGPTGAGTEPAGPSRRGFLRSAGLVGGGTAAGLVAGGVVGGVTGRYTASPAAAAIPGVGPVDFHGAHQAGVTDRAPAHLRFTALDLRPTTDVRAARKALQQALRSVTAVGAAMTAGAWVPAQEQAVDGLRPAHLTVTVGLGASALQAAGLDVPVALRPLPAFNNDQLDPTRSDGDLALQVCSEDAQLASSASRALVTAVAAALQPRWQQRAFLPGVSGSRDPGATPRNLMGQFDGTGNPAAGADRDAAVWVPAGGEAAWMTGGTYLVCRRIRMMLDSWGRLTTAAQEQVIGRSKATGAPLGARQETAEPDFSALGPDGRPVIATNAHLRLTHPSFNAQVTMLRRAYSYDDGFRADGAPDAGLFFQAFQPDPLTVFVPIMVKLASLDALMPFTRHEASAVFAVPPGVVGADEYLGQALLEG